MEKRARTQSTTKPVRKRGPGRPKKRLELSKVEQLYAIGCTDEEVAAVFGVTRETVARRKLEANFASVEARGRANSNVSVRRQVSRSLSARPEPRNREEGREGDSAEAPTGSGTSLPMKAGLLKRLKGLEEVRPVDNLELVEFQIGYLKSLPAEYAGERHIVTVGHDADGTYQWEERRGPAPRDEGQSNLPPFRVVLASAEDEPPAPGATEIDADITSQRS